MSKLIQLRQRSKAIETIKKITHAMRLISMSTHSHLQHLQAPINQYGYELEKLFHQLLNYAPTWHNPLIYPDANNQKIAIIVIGSQKGLCGSFNTQLLKVFTQYMYEQDPTQCDITAVGQKAVEFFKDPKLGQFKYSYEKFSAQRMEPIAREITHTLVHAHPHYKSVIIFSNLFKSFFVQKPHSTTLLPLAPFPEINMPNKDDFVWEQTPQDLLDAMIPQYIESKIKHYLFQSLISEHAARFISMDSATRNAKELLATNNLEYNKLRQAKITKELTELIGSYE